MLNKLYRETRFSQAQSTIDHERSIFNLAHGHRMSMNAGKLYPFFFSEVLPGDTFNYKDAFVCRASTPLKTPVMDTAVFDQWIFYVPMRLVWEHTKEFFGENNVSSWTPAVEYFIPALDPGENGFKPDGNADYFGLPTLAKNLPVDALPFRAIRLIWNEYFRDQNTQDPLLVNLGDVETDMTLDDLLPVNKRKDYFTTCLPAPQKGPDVILPLTGFAPVITRTVTHNNGNAVNSVYWQGSGLGEDSQVEYLLTRADGAASRGQVYSGDATHYSGTGMKSPYPVNLWTDFASGSGMATINDLRQAFAVQSLYELDARAGSRYREFLMAHFGVSVPDLTVQVPEFLAGRSTPLNVSQVVQTSATEQEVSAQGNVTGFSKTAARGSDFVKSFDEFGYVIGLCSIRQLPSYQQGLRRCWSRRSRFDMYHPVLARIGEQPVLNKEIYVYGDDESEREEVFGYQEAWADLRYMESYVSGAFRSNYPHGSLDSWSYTYDFDSTPRLSDGFIRETDANIGRTLATVNMEGAPQFLVDFWFDFKATRPLPVYGTPAILGGRQ